MKDGAENRERGYKAKRSTWSEPIHALMNVRQGLNNVLNVDLHRRRRIVLKKGFLIIGLEYL